MIANVQANVRPNVTPNVREKFARSFGDPVPSLYKPLPSFQRELQTWKVGRIENRMRQTR